VLEIFTVSLTSLVAGMALARRFNVWVLASTVLLTLVVVVGFGIANVDPICEIGLLSGIVMGSLEIGYLLELILQVVVDHRASRQHVTTLSN
jgi:hypothetical protein